MNLVKYNIIFGFIFLVIFSGSYYVAIAYSDIDLADMFWPLIIISMIISWVGAEIFSKEKYDDE